MKRQQFITTVLGAAAMPLTANAKRKKWRPGAGKGFKINAGEGRLHGHIKLKGVNANVLDLKIGGSDNNGGLALFEQTSITQGKGTPLHVHPNQDEVFYIIAGDYYFKVGDDTFKLTAGDSVFLPRGIPHSWTQVSENGKTVVLFQPAGKMENFFVTVAALDHEPTPQEIAGIFADNDMQVVGPPLKIG